MATTSEAATLIDVGYETLRNWLKRGLLQQPETEGQTWRRFGPADLCCLQLMKEGLAAGVSTETMLDVCGDGELRRTFERLCSDRRPASFGHPENVLVWPTLAEPLFMLVSTTAVADEIIANPAPVTIFHLPYIQDTVAHGLGGHA